MTLPISAVLFDAGGVICNFRDEKGNVLWTKNAVQDIGLSEAQIGQLFRAGFNDVLIGQSDTLAHFERHFENEPFKSAPVNAVEFVKYWVSKDCNINHATLALADRVNVSKYIATNQEGSRFRLLSELVGDHFEKIFASVNLKCRKPYSEFFTRIAEILQIPIERILLIDDEQRNVDGALLAGMRAHLFTNVENLERFLLDEGLIEQKNICNLFFLTPNPNAIADMFFRHLKPYT